MRLNTMFDTILTYKTVLDHLYTFASQGDSDQGKLERIRARRKETETKFEASIKINSNNDDFLTVFVNIHTVSSPRISGGVGFLPR